MLLSETQLSSSWVNKMRVGGASLRCQEMGERVSCTRTKRDSRRGDGRWDETVLKAGVGARSKARLRGARWDWGRTKRQGGRYLIQG